MKGFVNIFLAILLGLIVSPLIIIISILILIFERDTPFFTQTRLGLNKECFQLYKMRSMKDGSITRIGRVMRKTGIDELPQLINIIQGKITFVGPRPLSQFDIERLGWNSSFYDSRWSVKPGLSGLAQLSPLCNKKISMFWDQYYIKNRSLMLDLKISMASVFVLFLGKKSVKKYIQLKK